MFEMNIIFILSQSATILCVFQDGYCREEVVVLHAFLTILESMLVFGKMHRIDAAFCRMNMTEYEWKQFRLQNAFLCTDQSRFTYFEPNPQFGWLILNKDFWQCHPSLTADIIQHIQFTDLTLFRLLRLVCSCCFPNKPLYNPPKLVFVLFQTSPGLPRASHACTETWESRNRAIVPNMNTSQLQMEITLLLFTWDHWKIILQVLVQCIV